jgi:hypothetical protein
MDDEPHSFAVNQWISALIASGFLKKMPYGAKAELISCVGVRGTRFLAFLV